MDVRDMGIRPCPFWFVSIFCSGSSIKNIKVLIRLLPAGHLYYIFFLIFFTIADMHGAKHTCFETGWEPAWSHFLRLPTSKLAIIWSPKVMHHTTTFSYWYHQ
jgi:hypothetical protein